MKPVIDKYLPYLERFDMSENDKRAFIETLWTLMQSVADDAFGRHPVQQARAAKARENLQKSSERVS
jgi:hypothetical protein